jgi:hypothetical protein
MKVKYFKNYENSQDCYVGEKHGKSDYFNIVSASKNYFFLFANDEGSSYPDGRLDGYYNFMRVNKKDFEKLKDYAKSCDRKKGLTLLKKIHIDNHDFLEKFPPEFSGDEEFRDKVKMREKHQKAKPILE